MTMTQDIATAPGPDSPLGMKSWMRDLASAVSVTLSPPAFPEKDLPRGDGRAVLLIPGFLAGDWSMTRLAEFLRGLGYRVVTSGLTINLGPTTTGIAKLDRLFLQLTEREKISIIGQSLGGVFARRLAQQHPERIHGIVTLCTPIRFPVVTPLELLVRAVSPLHDSHWVERREEITRPLNVPVTAIYSEDDGIVDWRQCLDDAQSCENVCIAGSHATMGSIPEAQIAIAEALARHIA